MARGLTLDAGALIAADRRSALFQGIWQEAIRRRASITLPSPVFAQAWRANNPRIDRLLPACVVEPLGLTHARAIGRLLAAAGTGDVVDAMVVVVAALNDDAIVTSDPDDISRLVEALRPRRRLPIVRV